MPCLILTACGGGGGSPASPKPTAGTTTAAEPASGPAAVAAITANWKTVFNGKAPIPSRLALVQDGAQVAAFVEAQAKTSFGAAAAGSTATVSLVTITSPSQATVHYEVLLLGTPLLKNQVGMAVYLDGIWKERSPASAGWPTCSAQQGEPGGAQLSAAIMLELAGDRGVPQGEPSAARCLPELSGVAGTLAHAAVGMRTPGGVAR